MFFLTDRGLASRFMPWLAPQSTDYQLRHRTYVGLKT